MMAIMSKIWNMMKESDVDRQIQSSGSIEGNTNEKIRNGQSYLYRSKGMESEIFEIVFKNKIRGDLLNQALRNTFLRYPYLNSKMVEKDGDFYIVENRNPIIAKKTEKLNGLGGIHVGYNLIDITYYNQSIYVSFHHALCDGRGVKPFIETMVYYYCQLKYGNMDMIEGIRLSGEPFLSGETAEPFEKPFEIDGEIQVPDLSRDAFEIPIEKDDTENFYRYYLVVSNDQYMHKCKEIHATPVILLALAMNEALLEMYPEQTMPINANIASDMREALGCPNTFKNCVKSMILPYNSEFAKLSLSKQAEQYRELLKKQKDINFCKMEANNMIRLYNALDEKKGFSEKQKILSFMENIHLNTYVISYVGKFILGTNSQYIEGVHLYSSGESGIGINMTATDEKFVIDIKQGFLSSKYVKALSGKLQEWGIEVSMSSCIPFNTPTDKMRKRD